MNNAIKTAFLGIMLLSGATTQGGSAEVVAAIHLLQQTVAADDALQYAVITDTFNNAVKQLQTANSIYQTSVNIYSNAVQQYNELMYHTRIMGDPKNIGAVLNNGIFNQSFQQSADSIRDSGETGAVYDPGNEARIELYGSADPTGVEQTASADPLSKYRELDSRVDKYNAIETANRANVKENQVELKRLMDALSQAKSGSETMDQSKIMAIQAEMLGLLIKMQADQSKLDAAKQDIESAEKERANNMERMAQLYEKKREEIKDAAFTDIATRKIDIEKTRANAFGNTSVW